MKTPIDASTLSIGTSANSPIVLVPGGETRPLMGDISEDAFLGGRLHLLQPRRGYRAGLDAVLLAAALDAAEARNGRLLDAGAGIGTVGLCAARRIDALSVVLMERDLDLCALCAANIERNCLGARVTAVTASIGETPAETLAQSGLVDSSFSHVVANPPFLADRAGTLSATALKAVSHAHTPGQTLEDWCRFLARMCKPGGAALMIHRADALPAILSGFAGRFGAITIQPLHPHAAAPASRVIVKAQKASRAPATILPGLVLHDGNASSPHAFTPRIEGVLRHGAALW